MRTTIAIAVLLFISSAAYADDAKPERVLASAKLGGIVPLDGLSPFVTIGVEVGYVLPIAQHRIAIALDIDYTQPTKTGSEMDPRVAGGSYTWKLTQQELGVMPVALYRLRSMKKVVPYGGVGLRVLFQKSTVEDNGVPTISSTTETSTTYGVGVPVGAEYKLGPGRLLGELLIQYGNLDHTATGDTHSGAFTLAVGYRALL